MKKIIIATTLILLSGCSTLTTYSEYKATPDEVLERQALETKNLKAYHKAEREYYYRLAIQETTSSADVVASDELNAASEALAESKENAIIK